MAHIDLEQDKQGNTEKGVIWERREIERILMAAPENNEKDYGSKVTVETISTAVLSSSSSILSNSTLP